MSSVFAELQIQIHLHDGRVMTYQQDDADVAAKILAGVQPAKLFAERQLLIAGAYSLSGFTSDSVVRVDFIIDELPKWPFPHGLTDAVEIPKEEFNRHYVPEDDESLKREKEWKEGEEVHSYGEFELNSGKSVFAEFESVRRGGIEQRQTAHNFLTGSGFHIRRRDRGVMILNPVNIARWTIFPGPPTTPKNAWPAHYKGAENP